MMKCDVCGEAATNNKRMCDRCAKIIEKVIREVGRMSGIKFLIASISIQWSNVLQMEVFVHRIS